MNIDDAAAFEMSRIASRLRGEAALQAWRQHPTFADGGDELETVCDLVADVLLMAAHDLGVPAAAVIDALQGYLADGLLS